MGNILSGKIKEGLQEYTYNFTTDHIKLDLIRTQFTLENLVLNEKKINEILKKQGLPIKLKFGLLKKFYMKLSLIGAKLEQLTVDDLILIFGPADLEGEKFEGAEELEIYSIALRNHIANLNNNSHGTKYLDPELFAETERIRMQKSQEEREEVLKQKKTADEKTKNAPKKNPNESINIMGIEIFELIKNFLDCTISIQNIFIIYEDNLPDLISQERLDELIIMLTFNKFAFSNQDITKHTDKSGIFKNFMNVSDFLKKSGTWSVSDTAYWNVTFESFDLTFQTNTPLYVTSQEMNKLLDLNNVGNVLSKFYETKELNKTRNSFRILSLERMSFDIIMFYKETSLIPVHAVFMLLDFSKIEINLEAYKISTLFDILSYFKMKSMTRSFNIIRPKFKVPTAQKIRLIMTKLKLPQDQLKYLQSLRRLIIREYFAEVSYILHYESLLKNEVDPEIARLIILNKFCQESTVYHLIFGKRVPESLKLRPVHYTNLMKNKIKKVEAPEPEQVKVPENAPPIESFNKNPTVKILSKIHIHFRIQLKFHLNLYSLQTTTIENSLVLDTLTIDIVKPVAHLKGKAFLSINKLFFNYNKTLFANTSQLKHAIFENTSKTKLDKSFGQINTENLFGLNTTKLSFEVNVQESPNLRKIYLLYSDILLGMLMINYQPEVFKRLCMNLIVFKKLFAKSFNISAVEKGQKRNIKIINSTQEDFRNQPNQVIINTSPISSSLIRQNK